MDLSRASLAYAKRKTPAALREAIDYAQADILKLGGIGRSFDLVDATGVLHHMAEPSRPGASCSVWCGRAGSCISDSTASLRARRSSPCAPSSLNAAMAPRLPRSAASARTCWRARTRASPGSTDFFSTSECRDLLFHVQEKRLTIPELKSFIAAHGLKFIGFEFEPAAQRQYRAQFAQAGWSTSDLDRWQEIETRHPDTFSRMYRLWVQKP